MSKTKEALNLVNNGMSVTEAAKQTGVTTGSIYSLRSQQRNQNKTKTENKRTYRRRKKPEVIALNSTAIRIDNVFAFYGNPTDVANLVRSLQ